MKITKEELIELNACEEGLNRFIAQTNNTNEPVEVSSLVGGENTHGDLLWLAGNKLPTERLVKFTCDCALINIEKIEPYTDEYELIIEFLSNPTGDGAIVAANAADSAAYAVYGVYGDHADHAVRAARAAAYAANAAAHADAADDLTAAYVTAYATAAYADTYGAAENRDKVDALLQGLFA